MPVKSHFGLERFIFYLWQVSKGRCEAPCILTFTDFPEVNKLILSLNMVFIFIIIIFFVPHIYKEAEAGFISADD